MAELTGRPSEDVGRELSAPENYVHPQLIENQHLHRLNRLCVRRRQSMAYVKTGDRQWTVLCPADDFENFIALIEEAKEP